MESGLIPGRDGLYCICVYNIGSYTDEEVLDIFMKYGDVVKISRSGTNLGFVRYREFNEAKAAIDDMENNPHFKVQVARNKPDQFGRPRTDRNPTDAYHKQTVVNGRPSEGRHFGSMSSSVKDDSLKEGSVPPLNVNKDIPAGTRAKQLIIANLPHSAIQYQIYELCKPTEVLHVDLFTTYSNITYAHIHVRTTSDVEAIIKQLNNIEIEGKKVVVISTERLLTEYSTSGLAAASVKK